jgi:hypothetical protein
VDNPLQGGQFLRPAEDLLPQKPPVYGIVRSQNISPESSQDGPSFGLDSPVAKFVHIQHRQPPFLQEAADIVFPRAIGSRKANYFLLSGVILVQAPVLTRLLRARKRDRLPLGQLLRRFKSQAEFGSQYLAKKADIYIIENRGYFGFCASLYRRRIENQLNEILSRVGM